MSHHVAVWIDHEEARIFQIEPESFESSTVSAPHHHVKRKALEQGTHADARFYHEVAVALKGTLALLVLGPASAKLDFIRYLQRHDHSLELAVCGVETLDHPTDPQLVAYVRHHFSAKNRAG